jgi:hypothetical protein
MAQPEAPPSRPTSGAELPSPRAPRARLSIDIMGALRAALLDGTRLMTALKAHDIDELVWRHSDRMLSIDLAREQAEGRHTLAQKLERAIENARQRTPEPEAATPEIDLELYAGIAAELQEADDPKRALDDLGMKTEAWERLRRRWTRRALVDPDLAQQIRAKIAESRRALRQLE